MTERIGDGPPLVLLHGWGTAANAWKIGGQKSAAMRLAKKFAVHLMTLPMSRNLDSLAASVAKKIPQNSAIVGWSLGGLAAMQIAISHPQKCRRLVLAAATPKFVRTEKWQCGADKKMADDFFRRLCENPAALLKRFWLMQIPPMHRKLNRPPLWERTPKKSALILSLKILFSADMRKSAARIRRPTLLIHGGLDSVISPLSARKLNGIIPHSELMEIADAGHAIFISHPLEFSRLIIRFCGSDSELQ